MIILFTVTVVIALVELLGHLIICTMWVSLINPTFHNVGGICATMNNSAICICIFSSITLAFIVVTVLKFTITKNFNKWLYICTAVAWLTTLICVSINFSTLFDPNSEETANFIKYREQIEQYRQNNGEEAEIYLKLFRIKVINRIGMNGTKEDFFNAIMPYKRLLIFMIIQIIGITLLALTLFFFFKNLIR